MLVCHFILLGLFLVILETTFVMLSPVWPFSPDCHYILAAYLAYRLDVPRGLIILFPVCCALDVLSGTIFGMYALFCYAGYFLLKFLSSKLPLDESLYQIPLIGASYLLVSWVIYIFLLAFDAAAIIPWSWGIMLARTIMVMLLTYPFFLLFDFLRRRTTRSVLPWDKLRLRSDNRRRQAVSPDT